MAGQARGSWGVAAVLLMLSLTACEGRATSTPTVGPTSTPPPTSAHTSTSPPIEPAAQPAVDAYKAFNRAYLAAEGNPSNPVLLAGLRQHAVDPILSELNRALFAQQQFGIVYRGTLGANHITVTALNLAARPWPSVTLTDCPTGGKLTAYYRGTTKPVPTTSRSAGAPPPNLGTIQVIQYQDHWAVYKTSVDTRHTCTP